VRSFSAHSILTQFLIFLSFFAKQPARHLMSATLSKLSSLAHDRTHLLVLSTTHCVVHSVFSGWHSALQKFDLNLQLAMQKFRPVLPFGFFLQLPLRHSRRSVLHSFLHSES